MNNEEWEAMWTSIEELAANKKQLRRALLDPETGDIKKERKIQKALELLLRKASKQLSRSHE